MNTTTTGEVSLGTLEIGLLGPVTAVVDGTPAILGSRLQRAVLAMLALEPGTMVPTDRLAAGLWGDARPASSVPTLRAYVSRLRAALGARFLPRVEGGYLLDVPPTAVDVGAVAALVRQADQRLASDPHAARDVLELALSSWRGDPLADLGAVPFVATAVHALQEQRRAAELLRLRTLLVLGEAARAVDRALPLLARDPDDEAATRLAMVALYRVGRQADALERYEDLRTRLAEDLGADPGPAIRAAHSAILTQDPRLLAGDPDAPTAQVPRAVGVRLHAPSTSQPGEPPTGDPVGDPEPSDGHDRGAPTVGAPATGGATSPDGVTPPDGAAPPGGVEADGPVAPLPIPLTSFVGRQAQLTTIDRLVGGVRLLTLTGVGGVGKTRLALEAARRQARPGGDGPWLVELAGIADPDLVPAAVARSVGVAAVGVGPTEALVESLQDRDTMLVLDNCEHVVEAAADLVSTLLQACPGVRVLATSRQPLGVPGEQIMAVPSLRTGPTRRDRSDPGGMEEPPGEAVQLLVERARLTDPTFALDGPSAQLAVQLCEALDGIPLAIELAAGQLQALSLQQVVDLLEDRFELLQGPRGVVPRHRTLATAIAWSYDPLEPAHRELLHCAAVFEGGFDLSALAEVAGQAPATAARLLTHLVTASLVDTADRSGTRRFRVLTTIREYCRTRCGPEAWRDLQDRHAAWAVGVSGRVADQYVGDIPPWRLAQAEHDNLRAALRHAHQTGDAHTALRIAGDLSWVHFRMGLAAEGNRMIDTALAMPLDGVPDAVVAAARVGRSRCAYLAGDLATAHQQVLAAVEVAERAGEVTVLSHARIYAAYFHAAFGDLPEAERLLDAVEGDAGVPAWLIAEVDMVRGQLRRAQGRPEEAITVLTRAREQAEATGNSYAAASAVWILAKTLLDLGRHVEAARGLAEILRELVAQGDRSSTITSIHTIAAILPGLGRGYEAGVLLGATDALGTRVGFHPLRMDAVDGPRHRRLVTDTVPRPVLDKALAEGERMGLRQAVAVAVAAATAPPR